MNSAWQVTQESKTIPTLNNPLFIEGLPGIGNVGKIAVDFLVEELKAKRLFSLFSHKFPHSVFVGEDNLVTMPKVEIFYKKTNGKGRDLLLLTGDIQPIDEESCYTFCDEVLKIVKKFNCSEIITTGGIGLQEVPETPKVYVTGNDESLFKDYVKKGMLTEKNIYGVVGPIVGVSGVLLGLGKKQEVKGVALLAETFGHPMYLGIKGAKEILRVLEKRFKLGFNIKKMTKEITEAETELLKKTKEWASESLHTAQAGAKGKNSDFNYIG
jgi:uncharacterized protein